MPILHSIIELVGRTPLLELHQWAKAEGLEARILAKIESRNPAGSVKDRVALSMILEAEVRGALKPGAVIIEPTSGNTGIGLAAVAAARGYRAIFTMPETMSIERRKLLQAYGAEVVLTEGAKGMAGAIEKAEALASELPGSFIPGQFENPDNPLAHERSTGPEIWADTEGQVDVFVAGAGTGGTVSGTGRYLKAQNPAVKVVAVEPASSPILSGGQAGPHAIQGIGANFVPANYDADVVDEVMTVTNEAAMDAARRLPHHEGFLIGISGGAALAAATVLAKRPDMKGKTIVIILPDSGERYLSTALYADQA